MPDRSIPPGPITENMIKVIDSSFNRAKMPYFLSFGGLYAIMGNNGVIPDGDLDVCTYYGQDHHALEKAFASVGYEMSKCIIDDVTGLALHCGFNPKRWDGKNLHVCVMFMFPHGDQFYWCHDSKHELSGVGVPTSGYYFKGVEAWYIENLESLFRMVEWPGISQKHKIRAPLFSGRFLDECYPLWGFKNQKFSIPRPGIVPKDGRLVSFHQGGAKTLYSLNVTSMKEFKDEDNILHQLNESEKAYWKYVESLTGKGK